ncbi:MAG: bifunctional riboflavin kinase/FAD synthetase [Roseibium sp.]|nr:bifunctional riboflavin kinase/FAD synthetase [Roseibium sp.]
MSAPTLTGFQHVDSLDSFPDSLRGGLVAIGNFDGVHRGHRAVLDSALSLGRKQGMPVYAMTFEPHPRTFFNPANPVFRLTPSVQRAEVLEACGLDGVLELPFTKAFASIEAEAFVQEILIDTLRIRHAIIGYDFHFGRARAGTPDFLKAAGRDHGFDVTIVKPEQDEGAEVISSSRIRACLEAGDIAQANALLGYRWFVETSVQHGEKRGRDLGYPTANLRLADNCPLKHGIYAVKVECAAGRFDGVASFGRRPTFDNGAPLLEVFLFDFAGDLYGQTLRVHLVSYLRAEDRFDSVDALIAQMDRDSAEAKAALSDLRPLSDLDHALFFGG